MTQYDLLQKMIEATSGYVKNELTSTECSNIMTRALNEYTEQLNIAGVSSQRELLSKFAVFFAENMERGKTPASIVDEFYEAFGNSC